ncbi:TlpA family protein disulfide reductase [Bacillus manliponensis]|uniref:TlpA family protein disulfide reductase n=1 Tax=Bacillus manliponensis TaxID=574376 RepID=UPI0035144179
MPQELLYLLLFIAFSLITLQMFLLLHLSKWIKIIIQRSPHMKEIHIMDKAPNFTALDYQGHEIRLKELLKEKEVCLLFIDTDCSICKELLPNIQLLTSRHDIYFIIINENTTANDIKIQKMIPLTMKYIKSPIIFKKYRIKTVPQAILINQNSIVQNRNLIPDMDVLYDLLNDQED